MKPLVSLLLLTLLALAAPAPAAGTKADLKKMMAQLDKRWDKDLYEKVVKLGAALKMPIPEEGRKAFIIGESLFKQATGLKGAYEAANSFAAATRSAPWWGDAYWNEAMARQLAGQPGVAKSALEHYLLTQPSAIDHRKAQDKIYSFEADIQAVTSNQGSDLAGFWQQNGHKDQEGGPWTDDSTDSGKKDVFEFRPGGNCYNITCVNCGSEVSTGLVSCVPGRITFDQIHHPGGAEDDLVFSYDCGYENGVLTCKVTNNIAAPFTCRLIKRNACERVAGSSDWGYDVLCK